MGNSEYIWVVYEDNDVMGNSEYGESMRTMM